MKRRGFKFYLKGLLALTALFAAYCGYVVSRPDHDLEFSREVPTSLPLHTIHQSIWSVSNWNKWFYNVVKAERVDILGRTLPLAKQSLEKGALVRLEVHPRKGQSRGSFDLLVEISEFVPEKVVEIRLVRDGSGRIDKIVEKLVWRIELEPGRVRGLGTARTRHWRARLFAAISPRVLMNQLFYPDVMALGEFTQPLPPNPYPVYGS